MTVPITPHASLSEVLLREVEQLWEVPLVVAAACCSAAAETLSPPHPAVRHREDHPQLVVPEAFEAEGEPGLFA